MPQNRFDLETVISERDFTALGDALQNLSPSALADLIGETPIRDQAPVFRSLPREFAADVLEYLPVRSQIELLNSLEQKEAAAILDEMAPDDRTRLFDALPDDERERFLALLRPDERGVAVRFLGFPEDSVGRLATSDYVRLRPDWTIERALAHIRRYGNDSETLNVLYIIDESGKLIDVLRIRKLLLASPETKIADLMDNSFIALQAADDQETAIEAMRRSDLTALPVADEDGVLIGIVTVDDILDVAAAETTEDIHKLGGSEAFDEPYLQIALTRMVRKRAGWLVILFLGEMLTATAMGFYEAEIEKAVVLALFVPLIISSGGNSGSQAATLVVRAMALGEVFLRDWWRVMRREIFSGLILGAILGAIGFSRIALWSAFSNIYGEHWFLIALTVGVALIGIVLWGTLSGSMLPFILRRLGLDPAASSAPFVATLVDVTGLIIYFTTAIFFLRGTLL
ncbi:MAG: magnesium transporter [Pyrinomonadaceae bacterium]|nr:magnesium transporter [Pyrinomonadaceae bacterium]